MALKRRNPVLASMLKPPPQMVRLKSSMGKELRNVRQALIPFSTLLHTV